VAEARPPGGTSGATSGAKSPTLKSTPDLRHTPGAKQRISLAGLPLTSSSPGRVSRARYALFGPVVVQKLFQ
jgi:hypothetical protein